MSSEDCKTTPDLEIEEETDPAVKPVNKKRSKWIDFTIICYDQSKKKKVKYGMEKAVLATSSVFFNNLFEVCTAQGKQEELEFHDFHSDVVYKFLQIISGKILTEIWTIDHCADIIDLGQKYGADNVVQTGLFKFFRAFITEAFDHSKTFKSRYGRATLIKFLSLHLRMVKGELICSAELNQAFFWCLEKTWASWCKRCEVDPKKATISNFIDFETGAHFTGDDICIAAICIDKLRDGATSLSFPQLLGDLKKQKDERKVQSS